MSSTLTVYAIPMDRIKQVIGSEDLTLIDAIVASQEEFLASIDDIDDEAELTCAETVAHLVKGIADEDAPAYLYGYAFEAVCAHIGTPLPSIGPIAKASQWIEDVDALLVSKSVPVGLRTLVYAGCPVSIPEPDDSPCIGRWWASEVESALAAFQSLDLTSVDKNMTKTLGQIRAWLEAATKTPGASIIGFLS
jgi:hypothetical protein